MSILADIAKELLGMFLADARLSIAILVLVGVVAALVSVLHAGALVSGAILVLGSFTILVEAAAREANRRKAR